MMNNKGQALIEFIIILPIFLLLIIAIIDFGNILSKKYALENDLDTISTMYNEGDFDKINNYARNRDIIVEYEDDNEFVTIKLNKNIMVTSPMLNVVLGREYAINTNKTMYKVTHE